MKYRYGDQALFCRRAVFDALGGFPLVPLMEDYDFVQRVRKLSVGQIRIALNDASNYKTGRDLCSVTTSARRWEVHGVVWTTLINQVGHCLLFLPHDVNDIVLLMPDCNFRAQYRGATRCVSEVVSC